MDTAVGMNTNNLQGVRVLVVEDNHMVALCITEALQYADAHVVGVIDNLAEALAFIQSRHQDIDIAMLDVDLSGVLSYPIADLLGQYAVPFIFTTGYDHASMHASYRAFPVCMKPLSLDSVAIAIRGVLDAKTSPEQLRN